MKKYWVLSIAFFAILIGSTAIIKTSSISEGLVLGENTAVQRPLINPTEYVRKLTEAPMRKLTEAAKKSTINPTEYIKKLTEKKTSTGSAEKHTGESERKLTGKPTPNLTGIEERKQHLADQKLKICEEKSGKIVERSKELRQRVLEMEKKFTSIVDGVKEYYVKKELTVAHYEELIAAIDEKEKALSPLLETAKADMEAFSCAGENPSLQLKKYNEDMQSVLTALHDYRTSIKDLITAIKGTNEPEPTVSPTSTL